MSPRLLRPVALASAFVVECLLLPHAARADAIDTCTSAVVNGQHDEQAGKLRAARAAFLECVKPECPAEVRSVCDGLLSAVDRRMPTVILGARTGDGRDVVEARVLVDGVPLLESLDGRAIAFDPGPHMLRFERAGSPPVDLQVVLSETEKDRRLSVTFARAKVDEADRPAPREARPTPPLVYVLGGVGVAFLGGFVYLAAHGQTQYDACNPHGCSQSTVDGLSVDRGLAFGALGLGVVSLGSAAAVWLTRPSRSAPAMALTLTPAPGGAQLRLAF
jgi:hypothetical protein